MYHSELTIPVNRGSRTLAERRDHLFTTLEKTISYRKCTTITSGGSSTVTSTSSTVNTSKNTNSSDNDLMALDDEIETWLKERRSKWDEEINRIKRDMISMKNESDSVSQQQKITTSQQKSIASQQNVTSNQQKTVTNQSNIVSNINQSAANTDKSVASNKNELTTMPFKDLLTDAYEMGEDGKMHFKVRFDAGDYKAEDIKVTVQDNKLTVHAEETKENRYREFTKTIQFPNSVDHEKFTCELTKDGVLIIDAPVKAEHKCITFTNGLGIRATSVHQNDTALAILGNTGPTIQKDANGQSKVHVEVTVEKDYNPEDIIVRTEGHKILISGRHEVKSGNSSSYKQFSKYFEIPQVIDPLAPTAQLINGTLIIEAPLTSL